MSLLRVPQRIPTREMLIGTLQQLDGLQNVLVIVEDAAGVLMLHETSATSERLNWMLDRAKFMLHGV